MINFGSSFNSKISILSISTKLKSESEIEFNFYSKLPATELVDIQFTKSALISKDSW